jgi:hypothetical protein
VDDNDVRAFMRGEQRGENMEWNHDYFVEPVVEEVGGGALMWS